jgi:hypothetical protein
MNALVFVPVLSNELVRDRAAHLPTQPIQCNLRDAAAFSLRMTDGRQLTSEKIETHDSIHEIVGSDASLVGLLHLAAGGAAPSWMLIARSNHIGLNGQTPTLPIAAIGPGDLLSIGEQCWMVSSLWRPEPIDAPAELRDKPCPVCGGELGVARVVQCSCGRWSHLENPDAPDDPNALNCFLKAGACGECGRRASLEPQMIPEVPDSLLKTQLEGEE